MRPITLTPARLWIALAALITAGALGGYLVMQQAERHAANDPQIQLADDAATALEGGRAPAALVSGDRVDVGRSLAPFVVVLDDAGTPIAASGQLDGRTPVPPAGVLATVRRDGEERVTWAPLSEVRLASVVRRVGGTHPGFVVAARSLRETEARIAGIGRLIALGWAVAIVVMSIAVTLAGLRYDGQRQELRSASGRA